MHIKEIHHMILTIMSSGNIRHNACIVIVSFITNTLDYYYSEDTFQRKYSANNNVRQSTRPLDMLWMMNISIKTSTFLWSFISQLSFNSPLGTMIKTTTTARLRRRSPFRNTWRPPIYLAIIMYVFVVCVNHITIEVNHVT